ncbi:hypothetical protein EDB85DRAFT_2152195 [Lactarius pseudohatsudake]|nr:hypothetical protein EDB85DRAFT_2152195 [Lactarius pseudohatsudake]
MTPQTPGTYAYSLGSAPGTSSSHGSWPNPLAPGGSQSCFAVPGSFAEARSLHQRWRARDGSGEQEPAFIRSGGAAQQDIGPTTVPMAAAAVWTSPVGAGDRAVLGHGCAPLDTHQGFFPVATKSRPVGVVPSPHTIQISPHMIPNTLDDLSRLSHGGPSFWGHHGSDPSLRSPFVRGYRSETRDFGFELGAPPLTPTSPSFRSEHALDDTQDVEMNLPTCPIPHQRRPKSGRRASLLTILRNLQELKFTAVDLLMAIVDGNGDFEGFRNALFSPKNCASLVELLERLIQDNKGKPIVDKWMSSHALRLVCEKVHVEMEAAKPHLWMHTTEVSPEFIE